MRPLQISPDTAVRLSKALGVPRTTHAYAAAHFNSKAS